MRRKKPHPLLEQIRLEGDTSQGRSVTRVDGKVLFVDGAVPGDVVDVQVFKKKKGILEGRAVKLHEASPRRTDAPCIHFGPCGGCKWQNLQYQAQLDYKQHEVEQALRRIGGLTLPEVTPILGSAQQFRYRNKLDFAFGTSRWLTEEQIASGETFDKHAVGFHPAGRFNKVINVEECLLQPEPSNQIRNAVRDFAVANNYPFYDVIAHKGFMRNLIIRNTLDGEFMVIMVFGEDVPDAIENTMTFIQKQFPQVHSIYYSINQKGNDSIYDLDLKVWSGNAFITEKMEGLEFRISPKAFYQTNPAQAYELYKITRSLANLTGNENVYDLYTGTGTIASFISRHARQVVGIEFVEDAITDAKANAELNGLSNLHFYAGDMKKMLNSELIAKHGQPDVIITDPPRAGMDEPVVKTILEASPNRIVYVSCNPSTQARDLAILKDQYDITHVQPVDMFPHTYHVENVVRLVKR